jgi:LysM repeat protein
MRMTEQVFGRVCGSSPQEVPQPTVQRLSHRNVSYPADTVGHEGSGPAGDARRGRARQLGSRGIGREHLMTLITSARFRALSIISITVIVVLLFLSSAVQATGQVTETTEYRVKPGDTLWQIAQTHGPDNTDTRRIVAVIEKLNQIDGAILQAGQMIEIPLGSP